MSGGHFDYLQFNIGQISESIQSIAEKREFGFSKKTDDVFKDAAKILKIAEVLAQRIDWLVSGDDSEDTFYERLQEDLNKLNFDIPSLADKIEKIRVGNY